MFYFHETKDVLSFTKGIVKLLQNLQTELSQIVMSLSVMQIYCLIYHPDITQHCNYDKED